MKASKSKKRDLGWVVLESEAELSRLLRKEGGLRTLQKLRCLRFIRCGEAVNFTELSGKIGVDRSTLRQWRAVYMQKGLSGLLARGRDHQQNERSSALTPEMAQALKERMLDPNEGFSGYTQAWRWLGEHKGLKMSYKRFYFIAVHRLQIRLKRPRPVNVKKDAQAEEDFKKNLKPM